MVEASRFGFRFEGLGCGFKFEALGFGLTFATLGLGFGCEAPEILEVFHMVSHNGNIP